MDVEISIRVYSGPGSFTTLRRTPSGNPLQTYNKELNVRFLSVESFHFR